MRELLEAHEQLIRGDLEPYIARAQWGDCLLQNLSLSGADQVHILDIIATETLDKPERHREGLRRAEAALAIDPENRSLQGTKASLQVSLRENLPHAVSILQGLLEHPHQEADQFYAACSLALYEAGQRKPEDAHKYLAQAENAAGGIDYQPQFLAHMRECVESLLNPAPPDEKERPPSP